MRSPLSRSPASVDWNDPQLAALLDKSADWKLDNRSNHLEQTVDIHVGWQAKVGQHALLLLEHERSMVLATDFPIQAGSHVRVDRFMNDNTRTKWAVVVESRKGQREGDGDTFIHWLQFDR
jgi:hypothetical protein